MSAVEAAVKPMTFKRLRIPWYDDPVRVGARLHAAREALGLSQREIAFPGCSPAYISRIERGERVPSLQAMRELAKRVQTTSEYLAFGSGPDPRVSLAYQKVVDACQAGDPVEITAAYKGLASVARVVGSMTR